MDCASYPLSQHRVVAIATDKYLRPATPFQDPQNLPGVPGPRYGADLTFGLGRAAPAKQSVGISESELKPKMLSLLNIFAAGDRSGMAKRLFNAFLAKRSSPAFFEDHALNAAAANHRNIQHFCSSALSAPNSFVKSPAHTRIHQALRQAGWDITKVIAPTDLGVPAFNNGSLLFSSEDFDNGLGLMINGVQHAFVVATHYHYDAAARRYCIGLKFVFYDVFGLDDDDLREFGITPGATFHLNSAIGITAWWQLQHQFGYAPLVTRIIVRRGFEAEVI
jgi:hypothetical protein